MLEQGKRRIRIANRRVNLSQCQSHDWAIQRVLRFRQQFDSMFAFSDCIIPPTETSKDLSEQSVPRSIERILLQVTVYDSLRFFKGSVRFAFVVRKLIRLGRKERFLHMRGDVLQGHPDAPVALRQ